MQLLTCPCHCTTATIALLPCTPAVPVIPCQAPRHTCPSAALRAPCGSVYPLDGTITHPAIPRAADGRFCRSSNVHSTLAISLRQRCESLRSDAIYPRFVAFRAVPCTTATAVLSNTRSNFCPIFDLFWPEHSNIGHRDTPGLPIVAKFFRQVFPQVSAIVGTVTDSRSLFRHVRTFRRGNVFGVGRGIRPPPPTKGARAVYAPHLCH